MSSTGSCKPSAAVACQFSRRSLVILVLAMWVEPPLKSWAVSVESTKYGRIFWGKGLRSALHRHILWSGRGLLHCHGSVRYLAYLIASCRVWWVSMKVIIRSSSLLFIVANLLLGLPIQRRSAGGARSGVLPSSATNEVPAKAARS